MLVVLIDERSRININNKIMTKELKALLESNGITESQLVGKELDVDVDATGRLEEVTCMAKELGLTVAESEEEHFDALQLLSISGDAITVLTFLCSVLKKFGPSFVTMVRTASDMVITMKVRDAILEILRRFVRKQ